MRNNGILAGTRAYALYGTLLLLALILAALALSSEYARDAAANSPPGNVGDITLTRADGEVTASWDAVSGATKYHVTYTDNGGSSWHAPVDDHTNVTATSVTFDADNAKSYIVGVRAGNANGQWSGWRNSPEAGPYTPPGSPPSNPPGAVASVTLTRSDGEVTASWDAVSGATKYHATYTDDGKNWYAPIDDHRNIATTSVTFGADNSKTYRVGVRAGNSVGWSGWRDSPSAGPYDPPTPTPTPTPEPTATPTPTPTPTPEPTATPTPTPTPEPTATPTPTPTNTPTPEPTATPTPNPLPPAAPTGFTAAAGDGSVTLSWDDPANPSIARYEYNVNHNDTSTGNLSGWGPWTTDSGQRRLDGQPRHRRSDQRAGIPLPSPRRQLRRRERRGAQRRSVVRKRDAARTDAYADSRERYRHHRHAQHRQLERVLVLPVRKQLQWGRRVRSVQWRGRVRGCQPAQLRGPRERLSDDD